MTTAGWGRAAAPAQQVRKMAWLAVQANLAQPS